MPKEIYLWLWFPFTNTEDKNNNPSLSGKEHFCALWQQRKYSTIYHCDNVRKLLSIQMYSKLVVPEYWQGISKFTVCGQSQHTNSVSENMSEILLCCTQLHTRTHTHKHTHLWYWHSTNGKIAKLYSEYWLHRNEKCHIKFSLGQLAPEWTTFWNNTKKAT